VASDDAAGPLGKREADVARLVADGLTNKQIGTRLFISERTVDSHVRSILNKLGFNSRAQIAAWMASPNPPT
jgi:DNA-binding NarL/FixJ family response regulator